MARNGPPAQPEGPGAPRRSERDTPVHGVGERSRGWTFLTHHARVLAQIARNPQARMRDIAAAVGITERAIQTIVTDLQEAGYLTRERVGRRNHYRVDLDRPLRYPTEAGLPIRALIRFLTDTGDP
ncbi:MarR family transcriptional regulator [Nonomuraea sp. NN258]|uniref:helix-turn-helix transcriptional regulator n=1 Tax=Nonomuraea antri TaxID=2730852 RepID=UPI0015683669|nr:helix-turn-helix domain-containing protein [Nonomuraea antri]NRQ33917.1 MarR family transcriptional regulator [Nonomuraea antri]